MGSTFSSDCFLGWSKRFKKKCDFFGSARSYVITLHEAAHCSPAALVWWTSVGNGELAVSKSMRVGCGNCVSTDSKPCICC